MQNVLSNEYRSFIVLRIKNIGHYCIQNSFMLLWLILQQKHGGIKMSKPKKKKEEKPRKKKEEKPKKIEEEEKEEW